MTPQEEYKAETRKEAFPDKYNPEWVSPAYVKWLEKKYTDAFNAVGETDEQRNGQ